MTIQTTSSQSALAERGASDAVPVEELGGASSPLSPTCPLPVVAPVRWLQWTLAGLFFVLGVLGAVLPGLPATPFFLLCSYFLSRTSPRMNAALLRSPLVGRLLHDWQEQRGVRRGVKVRAILLVVVVVAGTVVFAGFPPLLNATIAGVAACGIVVVYRLPEIQLPEIARPQDDA